MAAANTYKILDVYKTLRMSLPKTDKIHESTVKYVKKLLAYRNIQVPESDLGQYCRWLQHGCDIFGVQRLSDLLPKSWQELATLVVVGHVNIIEFDDSGSSAKLVYELPDLDVFFVKEVLNPKFSFSHRLMLYASVLGDIKALRLLNIKETYPRLVRCQAVGLVSNLTIRTVAFHSTDLRGGATYTMLHKDPLFAKGCYVITCSGLEPWRAAFHKISTDVGEAIGSVGTDILAQMERLPHLTITKNDDCRYPFTIRNGSTSYSVAIPADYKGGIYDRLLEHLRGATTELQATEAQGAPSRIIELEPELETDDNEPCLFLARTKLDVVGIYSIRNFDPETMVVTEDEGGYDVIRSRPGCQDIKLELDTIFEFVADEDDPAHWYKAAYKLGKCIDKSKKYLVVSNPNLEKNHQAVTDMLCELC